MLQKASPEIRAHASNIMGEGAEVASGPYSCFCSPDLPFCLSHWGEQVSRPANKTWVQLMYIFLRLRQIRAEGQLFAFSPHGGSNFGYKMVWVKSLSYWMGRPQIDLHQVLCERDRYILCITKSQVLGFIGSWIWWPNAQRIQAWWPPGNKQTLSKHTHVQAQWTELTGRPLLGTLGCQWEPWKREISTKLKGMSYQWRTFETEPWALRGGRMVFSMPIKIV